MRTDKLEPLCFSNLILLDVNRSYPKLDLCSGREPAHILNLQSRNSIFFLNRYLGQMFLHIHKTRLISKLLNNNVVIYCFCTLPRQFNYNDFRDEWSEIKEGSNISELYFLGNLNRNLSGTFRIIIRRVFAGPGPVPAEVEWRIL